jgi:hypothetical protein
MEIEESGNWELRRKTEWQTNHSTTASSQSIFCARHRTPGRVFVREFHRVGGSVIIIVKFAKLAGNLGVKETHQNVGLLRQLQREIKSAHYCFVAYHHTRRTHIHRPREYAAVCPIPMRTDLTPNFAVCPIQNCVRKDENLGEVRSRKSLDHWSVAP